MGTGGVTSTASKQIEAKMIKAWNLHAILHTEVTLAIQAQQILP